MSTITLPNIRVSSDLTIWLKLKDGGVAIDWSTLTNVRVSLYSDTQRAFAGRCNVSIDAEDSTLLECEYANNKPQYLGVQRVIVQATYMGETKTYDRPAFNFVRWTDDQAGQEITMSAPEIDVEITVEDVSSSILQEAVDAAFSAADRANEAAEAAEHMVDIHTGPEGKSAYEVAVEEGYVGTEEEWLASLVGPRGQQGIQGETGEAAGFGTVSASLQEDGGEPSVAVAASGTDTSKNFAFTFKNLKGEKGDKGDQGNTGSSVEYPYELVNNLTTNDATKGLTAAMGVQLESEVSQLEAKVTDLEAIKEDLYGFNLVVTHTPVVAGEEPVSIPAGTYRVTSPANLNVWFRPTYGSETGQIAKSLVANTPLDITFATDINGVYFGASGTITVVNPNEVGDIPELKAAVAPISSELFDETTIQESGLISGFYISNTGDLKANAAFLMSDFYPVELFDKVEGMIGSSVVAAIAYMKGPYISNSALLGQYKSTGTANAPQTIDRTIFDANMPEGARYFAISTEKKTTNTVVLHLLNKNVETLRAEVSDLQDATTIKEEGKAYEFMNIPEYFNGNTQKFVAVPISNVWKRSRFYDLNVYRRVEATLPFQYGSGMPTLVFFNENKEYTRSEYINTGGGGGLSALKFVVEKTNDTDRYVVFVANIGMSNDYTFATYRDVKSLDEADDFSMMNAYFTEPRSGAEARLITSGTLTSKSTDEYLMIYCPGNTETAQNFSIPDVALAYFRSHKISVATLTYQATIYGATNTGWGNDSCYNAICDLYAYLMAKYSFRKSVIIAGGSMGGLTAGQIAYKRPFPVLFFLGLGPVPGLEICWVNAGLHYPSTIRVAMRQAYGLADDGSEDSQFETVSKGHDWNVMGLVGTQKVGFPNVYLYYGNDGVITNLFGGVSNYEDLRDALLNAGVYSMVKSVGNVGHADKSIFTTSITDGVWDRELKCGMPE